MQIRNKFYKDLREFTAWSPWGEPTGHTAKNDRYIAMRGRFVKQFNYPAELQKLIDYGWRSSATPKGPKRDNGIFLGNRRMVAATGAPPIPSPNPLSAGLGKQLVGNWDHISKFEQVAAYSFRGDTRPPEAIRAAGGFRPPSERTDTFYQDTIADQFCGYMERKEGMTLDPQSRTSLINDVKRYMANQGADSKMFAEYHFWRTVLDQQKMHIASMTRNSFLKAYISTTRDAQKAADASAGILGGVGVQQVSSGWIYCLRVKSGFLLKQGVGGIGQAEGEIAHLGPLDWKNVYGFMNRQDREIYIRNLFDQDDAEAFNLVLRSFTNIDPWNLA